MLAKNKLISLWPLLLLLPLYWLKSRVIIGSQITWFPQTDFYSLCAFIFIISLTVYNLVAKVGSSTISFFGTRERQNLFLLSIFIAGCLFFSFFALLRLFDISIEKPDMHAFITVLWNTAHGDILRSTYLGGARSWFSLHFEPFLFVLAPLFLLPLGPVITPLVLQILQIIVGVSGIIPVFLLTKNKLKSEPIGLLFALIYLLLPALQFQLLYDFHIEIVSLVAILWSIYFFEEKRFRPFFLTLLLAILVREEFAIYASFFGIYLLITRRKTALASGTILTIGGFAYWLLVKFLLIPFFGHGAIAPAQESMFSNLGGSPSAIIGTLFSKPLEVIQFMFTQRKIQYLVLMIVSTGFLSLLSPLILFTIPFFAINLLLNFDLPSSIFWHYQSWLLPIFMWATIDALARKPQKKRFALTGFILMSVFLSSLFFGPVNIYNFDLGTTQKSLSKLHKNVRIQTLQNVNALIPQDATVTADAGLAPFFAARKNFYLFPDRATSDYVVTSIKMFSRHSTIHKHLIEEGYCLQGVDAILIYKKEKACNSEWSDEFIEKSQPFSAMNVPITAKGINSPTIITAKTHIDPNKSENKSVYFLDYQLLAIHPNTITIYASTNGKKFKQLTACSAYSDSYCNGRADISEFINQNNELHIKIHLFADGRSSQKPDKVRVERLSITSLSTR